MSKRAAQKPVRKTAVKKAVAKIARKNAPMGGREAVRELPELPEEVMALSRKYAAYW